MSYIISNVMIDKLKFDEDLLFLVHETAQLMRRHADRRARLHGMTRAQWAVLARLERQPGLSQNELAHLIDVEPITVGRLVDRLEEGGFVQRSPDPADRRIWRLGLTDKATPILREIAAFRLELNRTMSEAVEPETLATLTRGLKIIRGNLSKEKARMRRAAP